jgi:two-component system cell cycle sensor histidine kinase/response regulator CckA
MTETRADNPVPARQPLRVLILEDDPKDAELLAAMLRRAGYSLSLEVTDSREQFQQRLQQDGYDVILADYNLGAWNAMDALQILRESGKDVPCVVVTGSLGDEAAVECIKQGAADYVLKDRLHRLPMAVDRTLREKTQREAAARLEEQIRRAKKEWEQTFDTVPDPVLVLGEQFRVKRANRAAARVFGLEFSQLIGQPCYQVVHGRDEPIPECPLQRMLVTGKEARADIEEPRLGKVFDATATPLHNSGVAVLGCVEVLRDISERKRMEEQLRQSQKMEAIGHLAGGVAHDFNNLLTAITGYSDLLLARLREGDRLRKHVQEIKKAGERAASLTRQLLAFSRRQVLIPQILDLNSVVSNVQKMLRRMIGEDIDLVTLPAADLGHVKADPGQIEQVIMNLAVNARDAMPQGGKLTVETANIDLDESYTRSHIDVMPGRYLMLALSDTGCGMDAETLSHIFEPFYTTKEEGKGTGLGLATVYGIVKQSGGHIWVSSDLGQGTTFKIYLPRVEAVVEKLMPGRVAAGLPRGAETVLLVEDEVIVRDLVREVLQSSGYTVLVASGAAEALAISEQRAPGPVHLMLTDVVMPEMDGPQLADHLARLFPNMKVLYMSGYAETAAARHSKLSLDAPCLEKPFAPEALARKVREVLDSVPVGRK